MPYEMHRIFCAPAGDLDAECRTFFETVGSFNEQHAMERGVLLVAVSLPAQLPDKRSYQGVIHQNIADCRYYIQLLEDTWGPPQKNYEKEHAIAKRCQADPGQPMQEVVVFFKKPLLPHKVEPDVAAFKESQAGSLMEFENASQLERLLLDRLAIWLDTIRPAESAAGA
ncbi:MAG: hypothetical protein ABJF23_30170 [Bryobacteraceae bacterium]